MSNYQIRKMKLIELERCYDHIRKDFPIGEYPPLEILSLQFQAGALEGLILFQNDQDLAYTICAAGTDYVLISLLAVYGPFRGHGVGSAFLQSIQDYYSGKQTLVVEVERPELAKNESECGLRVSRIRFYEQAGYHLIDRIDYIIWDVPMYLMVLSVNTSLDRLINGIQTIIYEIYLQLMGRKYMHKLIVKPI